MSGLCFLMFPRKVFFKCQFDGLLTKKLLSPHCVLCLKQYGWRVKKDKANDSLIQKCLFYSKYRTQVKDIIFLDLIFNIKEKFNIKMTEEGGI